MPRRRRVREGSHVRLLVWQKGMDLATQCFEFSHTLPHSERFGLSSQLRRAAVSIPLNIAEGNGRIHRREYIYHLSIARGSAREVETLLELTRRLGYGDADVVDRLISLVTELSRMLTAMIRRLHR